MATDRLATDKFLDEFPDYKSAVEELRPHRRTMLLWSVVPLVYVCSGLHLKVDSMALWGVQITGITEGKFTVFLLLAVFYYMVRCCWYHFLKLRPYWRNGFIKRLWDHVRNPETAQEIQECLNTGKGFNKDICSTVDEFTRQRAVSFLEHFGVPYVWPLFISVSTLLALSYRLLCSA